MSLLSVGLVTLCMNRHKMLLRRTLGLQLGSCYSKNWRIVVSQSRVRSGQRVLTTVSVSVGGRQFLISVLMFGWVGLCKRPAPQLMIRKCGLGICNIVLTSLSRQLISASLCNVGTCSCLGQLRSGLLV